ncbi:hypothetical protein GETHLI_30270 [Geothrix limicola]|uniref:Uncharacterized protein n=1 Tax=Geothrix limicola TaxID=2927978 RepID=A0ABQ5QK22_9BACT|nr:hypothetical protein [Geothrix limicola]GLH74525.1 hypothetical protein GETHLI_30270 [Geothrix limicola]
MNAAFPRAKQLALATALFGLLVGSSALWMGLSEGALAFWGFGAACLLQVPPSLVLHGRIREGLGNSGLERERLTLRTVSFLLRLLALGLAMAAVSALLGERAPHLEFTAQGLAVAALGLLAVLWYGKQGVKGAHPTLELDASRSLILLELAVLLLAGSLLSRWFAWADAVSGLAMALWLFVAGNSLAKASSLPPARGGCGGSCSCG